MNNKDKRQAKINELKINIKKAQMELRDALEVYKEVNSKEGADAEEVKKARLDASSLQAVLQSLGEELTKTKLNKLGSSFFEFTPSPPNRRMRKQAAKMFNV